VAKPRAILKRKKAVQNIAKITRTMQLIATAKFKRAFDRAVASRPYTDRLAALVADLAAAAGEFRHPLLEVRTPPRRSAILAVASNRGLAGSYNSGIQRLVLAAWRRGRDAGEAPALVVSGKKLAGALRFAGAVPAAVHTHVEDKPSLRDVETIAGPLVADYAAGRLDEVSVAYTKFESASRQRPVLERVLPFAVAAAGPDAKPAAGPTRDWIFDPDARTILTDLLPRTVRLRFLQAFLDAAVSEQVARMTAMKAATDNAQDMIKALGRLFNRSRQSQITTELSEIMGGAAALE
jgi:F-type H+-transporting ATPase subunit gamma